ncbi:phage tail protein [Nocardioides sp. BP30]|uniref:phage tail protein n=1 Tax=Nocardioides sp. BP30 TaxID=3036374 RepID=UPI002469010F|nr:phage tail protein [Nocardioides sp. BP30]WGL52092.1 phage tail protein [Nocardioides sp. BP30]
MTLAPYIPQQPSGQLRPRRDPDWMVHQLPVQMVAHDFFRRFVSIFQELGTTLLEDADNIDHILDVTVAPPELVRWLGSWISAAPIDEALPEELQRRMVRSAARTLTWRGTAHGLREFLELLSDGPAEVEDGGGIWRSGEAPADTAWVRLRVASTGQLAVAEFVERIRDEVPAHARAELYVGDELVWRSGEDAGSHGSAYGRKA